MHGADLGRGVLHCLTVVYALVTESFVTITVVKTTEDIASR